MKTIYLKIVFIISILLLSSCKSDDALKQNIADLTNKVSEQQKVLDAQKEAIDSLNKELNQTKAVVSKLSDVVLQLKPQKAEVSNKNKSNQTHTHQKSVKTKKTKAHKRRH
jgi:chromosome segregation ATPase